MELKKPFKTVEEQIQILQARGLIFSNLNDAREKLLNNNYYTVINGYKYPFLKERAQDNEQYKDGASFDEIYALYEFDCHLRSLLLKYILRIEHQLKSVISHVFSGKYCDIPFPEYLNPCYFDLERGDKKKKDFYESLIQNINAELDHQRKNHNPMLEHYEEKYNNIPPWILMTLLSFGRVRYFYCCLTEQDQNDIGRKFNLRPKEMQVYLSALNTFRNSCAHDERIYNLKLRNRVSRKNKEYNNVYVVVLILKDMLDSATFMSFYSELEQQISVLKNALTTVNIDEILCVMGMPAEPEVRKAELGALEIGAVFSPQEFKEILTRYILPILPTTSPISPTIAEECNNPRCVLVEYRENRIYFAQSTVGNFIYYVSTEYPEISCEQIDIVKEHLSTLIDYIHVFWNLSNLSVYGRDKVEIAFPNLCEQAYELTICNLMCNKERKESEKKYKQEEENYKRKVGELLPNERKELENIIKKSKRVYYQAITDETNAQRALYQILNQIEVWANKTYEGQRKTFGIIFCRSEKSTPKGSFDYINFLKTDFSATINDGLYSAVELYADGSFKSHISISHSNTAKLPSIPYPFTGFADLCTQDKIGLLLTSSGDILIINDKKLCYTKHNGAWLRSNSAPIIEQLKVELGEENSDCVATIYQTITDLSYSRGGACIGIVNEDILPEELQRMIEGGLLSVDILDEKRSALKNLIKHDDGINLKSFYELDRHLRRELLELDGAMVFSKSGLIHVIGTIIKLNGSGSDGGGRTAAAMQLSRFGLAIKISQDGYVQLFKNEVKILEILT